MKEHFNSLSNQSNFFREKRLVFLGEAPKGPDTAKKVPTSAPTTPQTVDGKVTAAKNEGKKAKEANVIPVRWKKNPNNTNISTFPLTPINSTKPKKAIKTDTTTSIFKNANANADRNYAMPMTVAKPSKSTKVEAKDKINTNENNRKTPDKTKKNVKKAADAVKKEIDKAPKKGEKYKGLLMAFQAIMKALKSGDMTTLGEIFEDWNKNKSAEGLAKSFKNSKESYKKFLEESKNKISTKALLKSYLNPRGDEANSLFGKDKKNKALSKYRGMAKPFIKNRIQKEFRPGIGLGKIEEGEGGIIKITAYNRGTPFMVLVDTSGDKMFTQVNRIIKTKGGADTLQPIGGFKTTPDFKMLSFNAPKAPVKAPTAAKAGAKTEPKASKKKK